MGAMQRLKLFRGIKSKTRLGSGGEEERSKILLWGGLLEET